MKDASVGKIGQQGKRAGVGPLPKAAIYAGLIVVLIIVGFLLRMWWVKEVHITVAGGEPITLKTTARNVGAALEEAGIRLRDGDHVTPSTETALTEGEKISVIRGKRIFIDLDGETRELSIADGTVRNALVKGDVRMGPMDRVVPVRETPLEDGMHIEVIRVEQKEIVETEPIPFRTLRWAEPHLPKGKERVVREGKEGRLEKRVMLTYENGRLVHRKELSHNVVEDAVPRIIGVGTRESVNVLETASRAYRYTDVKTMEATAYYPGPESTGDWADGYTYTGLQAGKGVVAVDPSVIPLGTHLYIPGYGEAVAADIGGAIKGNRIDLGFGTYDEAIQYGRKKVKVYILAN